MMIIMKQENRFHRNDLFNEEETRSFIKCNYKDYFTSRRVYIKEKYEILLMKK